MTTKTLRLTEWQAADPTTHPALTCGDPPEALQRQIAALNQSGRLEIVEVRRGLRIQTRSYVGTVNIGDLTVHIQPKIAPSVIPVFMQYALGLERITQFDAAQVPLNHLSFVDLLALIVLQEADHIFRAGLLQEYKLQEDWLTSPRGRIAFSRLASVYPRRMSLPCQFDRRTPDVPLNRVLRSTLFTLQKVVSDSAVAFDLHAHEAALGDICERHRLTRELVEEAARSLDRRAAYYTPLVRQAELVLSGLGHTFDGQQDYTLTGYLFDMNHLFERFVGRLCQEHAPRHLRIDLQDKHRHAYRYRQNPHRWDRPSLIPDIVVRNTTGEPVVILDTKYKLLSGVRPSSVDLYQMTLYSLAFGHALPTHIIYPSVHRQAWNPVLEFVRHGGREASATIALMGIDLNQVALALCNRDHTTLGAIVGELVRPAAAPESLAVR